MMGQAKWSSQGEINKTRLYAFRVGELAIIITIMVLKMKVHHGED